jgi:hypothetical protein
VIARTLSYVYFLPYACAFFVFWVLNFRTYPRPIAIATGVVAVFVLYRLLLGYRAERLASWHAIPLAVLWVVARQEIWASPAFKYRYEIPDMPGEYATCSFVAAQAVLFLSYLCILSSLVLLTRWLHRE